VPVHGAVMEKAIFMSSSAGAIDNAYSPELKARMAAYFGDIPYVTQFTEDKMKACREMLADVRYIFSTWGMPALPADVIAEYLPSLAAVFYAAGSVQGFARNFLSRGVRIFSAWGANGIPVAEVTVAQIILANKGYFQRLKCGSRESWDNRSCPIPFEGNYNTKVGIIGVGMIGREVIRLLKAYKLKVYVYDKFLSDEGAAELGVTKTTLEYIFSECSVISNHLANNAQTRGMLTGELFSMMKPGATFINTGRGAQVDEAGLARAMREVPTRIALLDVTEPEPPVPGSELYRLPNVLLSPHLAGSIGNEVQRMGEFMFAEFEALISGRPVKYEVTLDMLSTMA
jgi:phosphoglycerate dehydrogenase-like enzyme